MAQPPSGLVNAFSTTGTVLAVGLFASQIPSYFTVVKNKTVGSLSVIPTLGTWVNVSAWVVYGLVVGDSSVVLVNTIGALFALSYLTLFWLFSGPARCRSGLYIATVLSFSGLVFGSVALAPGLSTSSRALAMGTLGAVCGVVMYAAPIAQLRVALATFDPGAIPLLLVVVGTATSGCWAIYGQLVEDWFLVVPNVIGVVLGIVQLAIGGWISAVASKRGHVRKAVIGADVTGSVAGAAAARDSVVTVDSQSNGAGSRGAAQGKPPGAAGAGATDTSLGRAPVAGTDSRAPRAAGPSDLRVLGAHDERRPHDQTDDADGGATFSPQAASLPQGDGLLIRLLTRPHSRHSSAAAGGGSPYTALASTAAM